MKILILASTALVCALAVNPVRAQLAAPDPKPVATLTHEEVLEVENDALRLNLLQSQMQQLQQKAQQVLAEKAQHVHAIEAAHPGFTYQENQQGSFGLKPVEAPPKK